jgi:hypothetical protein
MRRPAAEALWRAGGFASLSLHNPAERLRHALSVGKADSFRHRTFSSRDLFREPCVAVSGEVGEKRETPMPGRSSMLFALCLPEN